MDIIRLVALLVALGFAVLASGAIFDAIRRQIATTL